MEEANSNLTRWAAEVQHIPTWALTRILDAREEVGGAPNEVTVDGLTVNPQNSTIVWKGETYFVKGRRMQLLFFLALARQRGMMNVHCRRVVKAIWRDATPISQKLPLLRVTVNYLRHTVPDLVIANGTGYYRLRLTSEDEAWATIKYKR